MYYLDNKCSDPWKDDGERKEWVRIGYPSGYPRIVRCSAPDSWSDGGGGVLERRWRRSLRLDTVQEKDLRRRTRITKRMKGCVALCSTGKGQ